MEYWLVDGWYVGRMKEVPDVLSQDEIMQELEKYIRDAYALVRSDADLEPTLPHARTKPGG